MNVDNNNIIDSVLRNEAPYMDVPEANLNGQDHFILSCSKFEPTDGRIVFNSVDITGHSMIKKGKSLLNTNRMTRKAYDKMSKHIEWAENTSKPTTGSDENMNNKSMKVSFMSGGRMLSMEIAEDSSNFSVDRSKGHNKIRYAEEKNTLEVKQILMTVPDKEDGENPLELAENSVLSNTTAYRTQNQSQLADNSTRKASP